MSKFVRKITKTGRYKCREIPEFKVSLGQSKFRFRHGQNGNSKASRSLNSSAKLKANV